MRKLFKLVLLFVFCICLFLAIPARNVQASNAMIGSTSAELTQEQQVVYSLEPFFAMVKQVNYLLVGQPTKPTTGTVQVPTGNGLFGFITNTIDLMWQNPAASSLNYVAYMEQRLHFPGAPKTALAADGGYGFNALTPVLGLWTVMRNLAYLVFAVIFIVVGIMIMLRIKIDPKTAATIQNSLPRIVFALILVTFSYAIAGFLIDLMYLLIYFVFVLIGSSGGVGAAIGALAQNAAMRNRETIFSVALVPGVVTTIGAASALNNIIFSLFTGLDPGLGTFIQIASAFIPGLNLVSGSFALLASLIIFLMIGWALFKTWLMLLNAYANIILAVILSPVFFMFDAIPGQHKFTDWLRGMAANLLAFPAVIGMIMLAAFFASESLKNVFDQGGFVPPLIGGNSQAAIQALLGLAIFLTIPKVVEILQEALKPPPFKFGSAWMESMAGPGAVVKYGREPAMNFYEKKIKPHVSTAQNLRPVSQPAPAPTPAPPPAPPPTTTP